MKVAIILNGISTRKATFYKSILPPLRQKFQVEVFETKSSTHAIQLASETASSHDVVLAAGGDGTLNQVLNGLLSTNSNNPLPVLGVIPLGSGNDFAALMEVRRIYIAPKAEPDDGLFNTLIATDMPLLKFLFTLHRLKRRQVVNEQSIKYGTANELQLSSKTPTFIETEGEMAGNLPANIVMLKHRIRFLA